ncbi:hypothetical protein TSUD_324180 [Trifolium subterraneum]|uniref:Reverse transcriptase domain-containing protein n=1 Tax=Trifolium subterraneum TaxID=3900 RepID=A0A2Z6NWG3_TRISU|nr:hypothetical protein TSUD_324180 [Trifolium subterraneum]
MNGSQYGFFNCKRGIRQGDPLSPLLFCLAEEVLSRGISQLVSSGKMDLIKGTRTAQVHSHCLYVVDIIVFCKGKISCLNALKSLFTRYALTSGQIINPSKSTIYSGGVSQTRLAQIVNLIGFKIDSLPFNYLGVPIFKGRPKAIYFYLIADKIKAKLSAWKDSLVSIAGRAQLVKSVIQSMLIYSISVYSWPVSLLKSIETWSRNFIWSGDINKRKLVTMAWKKVCVPYVEGGLAIRSLRSLNEASNLKLCWELLKSNEDWAKLFISRVVRPGHIISHHINSSIWSGIKSEYQTVLMNSRWQIGNGLLVNIWEDAWCGDPLIQTFQIHANTLIWLPSKVNELIRSHQWCIPAYLNDLFPNLRSRVQQVIFPVEDLKDNFIWKASPNGDLSMKDAYEFKRLHIPEGNRIPYYQR